MNLIRIEEIFDLFTARSKGYVAYSRGDDPFISNGFYNNGVIGFVEPYGNDRVFNRIGICVSAFCEATVQLPPYLPRGNGGSGLTILIPKNEKTSYDELLQFAAIINTSIKWRYSYGRMVNKSRLAKEEIPIKNSPQDISYGDIISLIPQFKSNEIITKGNNYKQFPITSLFHLQHGDFHSIDSLDKGSLPTVSRVATNNGIVGNFNKPNNAIIYPPLSITVSTVTGDAFLQVDHFIATDNVVILTPKYSFSPATLFFITLMINKERWRWMYGRQCYKTKFAKTKIFLFKTPKGKIDVKLIESIVEGNTAWQYLNKYIVRRKLTRKSTSDVN